MNIDKVIRMISTHLTFERHRMLRVQRRASRANWLWSDVSWPRQIRCVLGSPISSIRVLSYACQVESSGSGSAVSRSFLLSFLEHTKASQTTDSTSIYLAPLPVPAAFEYPKLLKLGESIRRAFALSGINTDNNNAVSSQTSCNKLVFFLFELILRLHVGFRSGIQTSNAATNLPFECRIIFQMKHESIF